MGFEIDSFSVLLTFFPKKNTTGGKRVVLLA